MTQPWLDPDPRYVPEPEPDDPPMSPRTRGCIWLVGIGASATLWFVIGYYLVA